MRNDVLARVGVAGALACSALLALTGCSGASAHHPSGSPSHSPTTFATFSGSESGKVTMNLCDPHGTDSIVVVVSGTKTRLPGVVSSKTMNFDGKDSIYTIDATGPLPAFATDGSEVDLDGVILRSALDPSKKLTFAGSITCP
jgi:hypothetical protein